MPKDTFRRILARYRFFDKTVHHEKWKDSMSGKNEKNVIKILDILGYELNKDFVRQHPIGEKFVIDFAFLKERVALEADGESHNDKQQRKIDNMRDKFLERNRWIPLRIKDEELFGKNSYKTSFYKNLIRDVVEERRKQYEKGHLYPIDIENFNEADYE